MQTMFSKTLHGLFASAGQIYWNRFTGPAKIALQTMYFPHGERRVNCGAENPRASAPAVTPKGALSTAAAIIRRGPQAPN